MSNPRRFPVVLVVLLVLAAGGGGGAWLWLHRSGREDKAPYRTETIERGDLTMTITATGTLSAVTTVQVGSQVSGIISALHADFNSQVKKNDLLAELDPKTFQDQVDQRHADLLRSQADLANARVSFERAKKLRDAGLEAEAEFDAAKARLDSTNAVVDQTRAALSQAVTSLKYTKILSPIDGVVVDRQYDVGQTVAASFQAPTLFTIAQDLTQMQVQSDVDQSDIGRVQLGQAVRFSVDAYPDQEFRGHIAQIRLNATVNQNVITYPVMILVPNPELKLRPKMTANVTIEVATVKGVLRVANAALRFRPPASARGDDGGARAAGAGGAGSATGAGAAGGAGGRGFEASAAQAAGRGVPGGGPRGGTGGMQAMGRSLDQAAMAKSGGHRGEQTLQLLDAQSKLKPVKVRTGISDGKYTEIVSGDVKEGDKVAVGLATLKVDDATGGRPGAGGPPGMRRF